MLFRDLKIIAPAGHEICRGSNPSTKDPTVAMLDPWVLTWQTWLAMLSILIWILKLPLAATEPMSFAWSPTDWNRDPQGHVFRAGPTLVGCIQLYTLWLYLVNASFMRCSPDALPIGESLHVILEI